MDGGPGSPFYSPDIWLPVNTQPAGSAIPRWEMARQKPRAHFKMGGPLVAANELIAFHYGANVLHLPLPRTWQYNYAGPPEPQTGTLSLEDEDYWGLWQEFVAVPFFDKADYAGSCRRLVTNVQALREVLVLDIWIRNVDRHFGNILVNEHVEERQYSVAFIDHSHIMLGPDRRYEHEFLASPSGQPRDYLRGEEVALAESLIYDFAQVEDAVFRISSLTDDDITVAVTDVCPAVGAGGEESASIIHGLTSRRDELAARVQDFVASLR